jgi:hypothetical protein
VVTVVGLVRASHYERWSQHEVGGRGADSKLTCERCRGEDAWWYRWMRVVLMRRCSCR